MKRKKKQSDLINCEYFAWRLRNRKGVFYADGRFGKFNRGKHSLGTKDRDEALENLKQLDRYMAVKFGLVSELHPIAGEDIPIQSGWDRYIEHCARPEVMGGTCESSRKRYRTIAKKFTKFCEEQRIIRWQDVDKNVLNDYVNWPKLNIKSEWSYFSELTVLKVVSNFLIESGRLPEQCRIRLRLSKPRGTNRYCFKREEVQAMIEHCMANPSLHWIRAIIVGLACTGLRISELLGLRWSDIDVDSQTILLSDERASGKKRELNSARRLKGRRSRRLPIHPKLWDLLSKMQSGAGGLVFRGSSGQQLAYSTVYNAFIDEVIQTIKNRFPTPSGEVGFQDGRFHGFRHFFCSEASRCGVTEGELMEWLGHRESEMVAHYRHLRADDSQRRMQGISFFGERQCGI